MGWVDDAALFRDAVLHEDPAAALANIEADLAPALVGSGVAVRRMRAADTHGSIVQVPSHQAQRAVAGALLYDLVGHWLRPPTGHDPFTDNLRMTPEHVCTRGAAVPLTHPPRTGSSATRPRRWRS